MSNFIKEWTHKEVEVLTRSFRRYSFYVIILKYVLPLTALIMAGALFLYPALTGKGKKIVLVAQQKKVDPNDHPIMTRPKFVGMDSHNQPYQVSANKAVQQTVDFTTLDKVVADMSMNNDSWVSCVAKRGNYDSVKHYVMLDDDVNVFMVKPDNTTYQALTQHAEIDMDNGIMKGDNPVRISSDAGTLTAEKFLLERDKQKITFQGNVKVVIFKQ